NAMAFERIGAMWLDEGAPLRAVAFLAKASELDPNSIEYHTRLARAYLSLGHFADARKEALKVLERFPDNNDAIVALTEAAQNKEEIEQADEQLQKFPKKDNVSFHLASANLFLREGNLSAAEDALRKALNADPKSAAAHMAMGDLHVLQKDLKQ